MKSLKEQTNFLIATALCIVILVVHNYFTASQEQPVAEPVEQEIVSEVSEASNQTEITSEVVVAANDYPKLQFANSKMQGTIHLQGAFITDVQLADYKKELNGDEPFVLLASKYGKVNNFSGLGWISSNPNLILPTSTTQWTADSNKLSVANPVTLTWNNGQGITFKITYFIDEAYLLSVKQEVINNSDKIATFYPYAYLERRSLPDDLSDSFMMHQGINGYLDGGIEEVDYDDLDDEAENFLNTDGGWIAFVDRYWLAALAFPNNYLVRSTASNNGQGYRIAFTTKVEQAVVPGASLELDYQIYTGVKEKNILKNYEEESNILQFSDAIDWGWLFFITKPLSYLLELVQSYVQNYGVAIILLTILIKMITWPITRNSQKMPAKMRELKPEIEIVNQRFKDDKERIRVETMKLYKKHNINPLMMIIPFFLQVPVFLAFYKSLTINVYLRHAPFFGWIQDLSVPDPTNFLTLFGYLPIELPFSLQVSVLSLFAGLLLWLQFKYGATSSASGSGMMFMKIMPIMLIFVFARIPSAILLYICTSSAITASEQLIAQFKKRKK